MSQRQRSVLVTGASSGIGLCVARGLARRGYQVVATARKPADIRHLRAAGLDCVGLDLASSASITNAVEETLAITGGRLYGLFNNAAYGQPGAVEDLSRQALREQFEVNLFGTHELTRLLIPVMRAQGYGRIIQDSSVLGFVALPYRGAYNASKFALEGLSDTLRMELEGSGVQVILIQPGPILSRFRQNAEIAFRRHIDAESSIHRDRYRAMTRRLQTEGAAVPFTLPPEAVLRAVVKALEHPRPRYRYRVTFPTRLFALLKRILPYRVLERILMKV